MLALRSRVDPNRHLEPLDLHILLLSGIGDGLYDLPEFAQSPDSVE